MTTSPTTSKLTFEEYLNYDDGTDNHYELEDGELILMKPPIGLHALILRFLDNMLEADIERLNLPWATLQLMGIRTAPRRSRLPDLCVMPLETVREYLNVPAVVELEHCWRSRLSVLIQSSGTIASSKLNMQRLVFPSIGSSI